MRRSLVVLLALVPAAATFIGGSADAAGPFPKGEVVVRPSCFGQAEEEKVSQAPSSPRQMAPVSGSASSGSKGKSSGGLASSKKAPTAATAPMPSAMPTPPPPPPADNSRGATLTKDFLNKVPAGRSYQSELQTFGGVAGADAASASTTEGPVAGASRADNSYDLDDAAAEPMEMEESVAKEMSRKPRDEKQEQSPVRQVMDWGATIFLSNDDSMSLASAQRLLYAVKNGVWFSPSEVRPHELLNYFSFDTVTPDADQAFDVLASAEQDGDLLTVALSVKGAVPERQPLDLTAIIDVSCSMEAEGRMEYTQRGLHQMAGQLERGDRIDIVMFDDSKCVPLENYVVGRDDPALLTNTINSLRPKGGTDLDLGLREGYRVAKSHVETNGRNRRMMLLTDAQLNTGDVNPNTVSEIGKAFDGDGIRLTGVGVGRDFNDKVLDMLTEKGKGAYVYLGSEAVVDRIFGTGFASLTQTLAHDVQFELQLPDSLAMERFYGEEASTNAEDIQPINYYAGTSQVFLQDLNIKNGSPVRKDPVLLTVRYRDAITGEPEKRVFKTTVGAMLDADPHNVRKAKALMMWTDVLMEKAMHGDPCGDPLRGYARYAGMLGDDAEIGYLNGLLQDECGAFDLPAAVSSKAVSYKVKVDADIPIAEVALACNGSRWNQAMSGSTTVARFDATPGACQITLSGTVDMTASVDVPETGGDVRCVVRGGRLACL